MESLQVAASDLTHTARLTAAQVAQTVQSTVQTGTKGAAEQFQRFVEGEGTAASATSSRTKGIEPEKKDFWDAFGAPASGGQGQGQGRGGGAIGTAAVRKAGAGRGVPAGKEPGKEDGWGEDGWEKF